MLQRKKTVKTVPERQRLELLYNRYRHAYEDALNRTYRKARKLLIKSDLNFNLKYRVKSFESYFGKIIRLRQEENDPIEMTDVLGLRIIVPFLEDVDQAADYISQKFKVLEIENKGENNSFREFSYDSIHLLIDVPGKKLENKIPYVNKVCEIQIRTILQEAWAEVEHELIYKAGFSALNEPVRRKLASLNASLTLSDTIFQEIRDYQKTISASQKTRQETFFEKALSGNGSGSKKAAQKPLKPDTDTKIIQNPLPAKNDLEKQIFQALEAHSQKKYKQAIKLYSKILHYKLKPQIRALIYNHRGMAHFICSDYEKAVQDFTKALENDPQNPAIINNRGLAYRMVHQYDKALPDFEQSIKINPFEHETYHMRALTYFDIDDLSKAFEDCEKTLDIKPEFEPAKRLKSVITSQMGF